MPACPARPRLALPAMRPLLRRAAAACALWLAAQAAYGQTAVSTIAPAIASATAVVPSAAAAVAVAQPRRVLVLYSLGNDIASPWQALLSKGLHEELAQRAPGPAPSIFEERLDALRVGDQAALASMAPYLQGKYANIAFDAIVTENYTAAGFLNKHPELFPGVPRYYVNHGRRNWHPEVGTELATPLDFERTIDLISHAMPAVKRIIVVGDDTTRGQKWMASVREAAQRYQQRVAFDYWNKQTFDTLYRRASMLGKDSALFVLPTFSDQSGARAMPTDVMRKLVAVSPAPVFTNVQSLIVPGVVGGYVLSGEGVGAVIGRILLDKKPDLNNVRRYVFNYPALERYGLDKLPPGATILDRPQGVWELYRWQIIAGLTLILLEGVLITALVAALRDRRRTLTTLHDERNNLEDRVLQRTLELLMANTKLEQLATTDPLTGIANRRKMTDQIARELERARRFRHPLALLMVDIDHFKRINDTYGHEVGDRAIVAVARTLADTMRSIDMVARFGGEEFVLLMPETNVDVGGLAAERLRNAIAGLRIDIDGGLSITLTISVGVAASSPDTAPDTPSSLLVRADKALYRAKKEGRDRVVLAA